MKRLFIAVVLIAVFASAAFAADVTDPMEFSASNGGVIFYHSNHVNEVNGDCTVCHQQDPGLIPGFGKKYAHDVCVGCHSKPGNVNLGIAKCERCHTQR
ncbi:MAG: cytochrome c3 family protein [Dissulfurispiraceae bacterium]